MKCSWSDTVELLFIGEQVCQVHSVRCTVNTESTLLRCSYFFPGPCQGSLSREHTVPGTRSGGLLGHRKYCLSLPRRPCRSTYRRPGGAVISMIVCSLSPGRERCGRGRRTPPPRPCRHPPGRLTRAVVMDGAVPCQAGGGRSGSKAGLLRSPRARPRGAIASCLCLQGSKACTDRPTGFKDWSPSKSSPYCNAPLNAPLPKLSQLIENIYGKSAR